MGPHAFVFAGESHEGTVAASPAQAYALAPQIPPATQATKKVNNKKYVVNAIDKFDPEAYRFCYL